MAEKDAVLNDEEEVVLEETDKKGNKSGTYTVWKRKEDKKWAVKVLGSDKVIKLFNTKKEALDFVQERAERNGRATLVRNSKGKNAGRYASDSKAKKK